MEGVSLQRLERMARNMPVKKLAMHSIEDRQGVIYFAYGEASNGAIHGIWGYRDIGRTVEFKKDTSIETVKQLLVNDAVGHIEQLIEKGLLSDGG